MKSDLTFFHLMIRIGKSYTCWKASDFYLACRIEFKDLAIPKRFIEVWLKTA